MSRLKLPADVLRRATLALAHAWDTAKRGSRLAVGIPDYDAYVAHLRERHPGQEPMDREAFFHDRVAARYGRGRSRCC